MSDPADIARRKAEIELALLEEQLTPAWKRREWIKALASASGVILAVVALLGAVISAGEWFASQRKDRDVRTEERFERTLSLLSEARPPQRAAALTSLGSFIDADNQQRDRQVLVSVANALPLEDDPSVRGAMVSFFDDVDPQVVGTIALDAALKSLSYANRDLMQRIDYWRNKYKYIVPPGMESKEGGTLNAMAQAMASLMRKGARVHNLSGVFLRNVDLSGLDLTGTNFDDAILELTNFQGATLVGASFIGADLQYTPFVSADLRLAQFRFFHRYVGGSDHNSYLEIQVENHSFAPSDGSKPREIVVGQPDFGCADLRGADFSGFFLWNLARNDEPLYAFSSPAVEFGGADLAGADFRYARGYAFVQAVPNDAIRMGFPFLAAASSAIPTNDGTQQLREVIIGRSDAAPANAADFSNSLGALSRSLDGTNWTKARLPHSFGQWIGTKPPDDVSVRAILCKPRHPH